MAQPMPDAPDHSACVADHGQVPLNYWNSLLLHLSLIQGMRKKKCERLTQNYRAVKTAYIRFRKTSPITNAFLCKNIVMHLRGAELAAQ